MLRGLEKGGPDKNISMGVYNVFISMVIMMKKTQSRLSLDISSYQLGRG
jgi:hypothetical protein